MSYQTLITKDAEQQRLYIGVIDETGVEQVQYGRTELKLDQIRAILAATTPTAVSSADGDEPGNVIFREVKVCLDDGSQAYAIVLMGGLYTKPA